VGHRPQVTGFATLITGAEIAGIDPFLLHGHITRTTAHGRSLHR
jgi:hypothetical protein